MTTYHGKLVCDGCHGDLSNQPVNDAKTKAASPWRGQWGAFCDDCHVMFCIGHGYGIGQRFTPNEVFGRTIHQRLPEVAHG